MRNATIVLRSTLGALLKMFVQVLKTHKINKKNIKDIQDRKCFVPILMSIFCHYFPAPNPCCCTVIVLMNGWISY